MRARGEVSLELKSLLGETGAQAVQAMLAGASRRHDGLVAGMIGVGTLLLAAIWVVVALKKALNTIWDVVAPPSGGVWLLAKSYLASLVGVLALGFLLLVSLLVTTVLAEGAAYITPFLSEATLHAISFLLSFAMVGLLFAMMFKWLPDTDIAQKRLGAPRGFDRLHDRLDRSLFQNLCEHGWRSTLRSSIARLVPQPGCLRQQLRQLRLALAQGQWPQDPRLGKLRTLVRRRDRGRAAGRSLPLPSMAAITPKAGMMLHCGK
jgi:hypothetical protein